jgi:hypothetical protein
VKLKDELSSRHPPVRLIAIAGEHLGAEEFADKFWPGELFYDLGKAGVFKVMGSGSTSLGGLASYLVGGAVKKNVQRCDSKGVEGNMVGEGFKLGGVWVVSPASELVWEHNETTWGDIVEGDKLTALRAALAW